MKRKVFNLEFFVVIFLCKCKRWKTRWCCKARFCLVLSFIYFDLNSIIAHLCIWKLLLFTNFECSVYFLYTALDRKLIWTITWAFGFKKKERTKIETIISKILNSQFRLKQKARMFKNVLKKRIGILNNSITKSIRTRVRI